MAKRIADSVKLFADGLTLVYHEARNVRFLIEKDHRSGTGWDRLVSLPKNRVEAWRALQPVREAARSKPTARDAAEVFQERFGRSLGDLAELYEDAHWRHAHAYGGHAWRTVTAQVSVLGRAIDGGDPAAIAKGQAGLLQARHNNGPLRCKITELDAAIGVATEPWWKHDDA